MNEKAVLDKMKTLVLQKLKHTLDSPSDFDYLSLQIYKVTGESVSSTTLKRIFGYIPSNNTPRRSSLSIIARYLGFSGWSAYAERVNVNSGFFSDDVVLPCELLQGDKVKLEWAPDRVVLLEALGDEHFRVIKSLNSQLQMGDLLEIPIFMLHQPLLVKSVMRDGENYGQYTAGINGGLSKLEVVH